MKKMRHARRGTSQPAHDPAHKEGTGTSQPCYEVRSAHLRQMASREERKAVDMAAETFVRAVRSASGFQDEKLRSRLEEFFITQLNNGGYTPTPGKRPLLISKKRKRLRGFAVYKPEEYAMKLKGHVCLRKNHARTKVKLHLWEFRIKVNPPYLKSATHIKVFNLVGTVSDVVYDETSKRYKLADERATGLSKVTVSDYIPLSREPLTITMDATLPGEPKLTKNISVIQAVGFALYKEVDGEYWSVEKGKMMEVVVVY